MGSAKGACAPPKISTGEKGPTFSVWKKYTVKGPEVPMHITKIYHKCTTYGIDAGIDQ